MKVTDPWKKALAALAAGGMFVSGAAYAANLNENLVVNGDFETIDPAVVATAYNAPKILNWAGVNGFAYSHDGSSSNFGTVPNYADGTPPPPVPPAVTNHWYFTSNSPNAQYINAPGQFYQDIDVSTGATNDPISTG
jgi:hypothetical protein